MTGPSLTNTLPAIAVGTLEQSNQEVSTLAVYTFTYFTVNEMPVGSCFKIQYPSYITPAASLATTLVVFKSQTYPMGYYVDTTSRTIELRRGLPTIVPAGSKLQIKVGMIMNPESQLKNTETFEVTSYTDDSFSYNMDAITTNLIPGFKCSYPCASCPSKQQSTVCLSCHKTLADVPEKYLNGTKCLSACPANTLVNEKLSCIAIHTKYLELTSFVASQQPAYYSF